MPASHGSAEPGYAGFWRRVAAFIIDGFLLGILGQLLGLAFASSFAMLGQAGRLIGFVIAAAYVIPAHHRWGQTLGKRLLGIQVRTIDGRPLSAGVATLRYLALAIPWFLNGVTFSASNWPWLLLIASGVLLGSVLFIGTLGNAYLLLFNRPSRRLIHDWIAGTVVVRAAPERAELSADSMRLAPVHWVIVGLIPVFVLTALGWIALRLHMTTAQIANIQSAQEALNRIPGILQGGLVDQHNFGPNGQAHIVAVQLWITDWDLTKRRALQQQAIATVFQQYPSTRTADSVTVVSRWGFDIGIASSWRSDGEVHSVTEWQHILAGTVGRTTK